MATNTYKQPTAAPSFDVSAKDTVGKNVAVVGNVRSAPYPATKTSGIKIRGTGAATKGVTARGPMA